MTVSLRPFAPLLALALVAGCSDPENPAAEASAAASSDATAMPDAASGPAPSAAPSATASPVEPGSAAATLRLEGLGDLVIGKPVPAKSSWAMRGAQIPGVECKTYSSPAYPGVYALVEEGAVKRISVGGGSPVKLVEGIGVGSSEGDVLKAFPGFKSEPHKYVAAPAKYLTQPGSDPRLRFEIDEARQVSTIHVGVQPQIYYVEGCA